MVLFFWTIEVSDYHRYWRPLALQLHINEGALWPYIFENNKKDKSAPCPFSLDPNHVHGRGRTHGALIQNIAFLAL